MSVRPRVAFVVARCGEDISGGAEAFALESARAMNERWECEILTTCARDARTWTDSYAPGPGVIAGVKTLRFPVDRPRDPRRFDRASARIARNGGSVADQEAWMREQGPYASGLFAHLRDRGHEYDCVFFFSYLYATTYFGLPLVADRAVLVPLAHAEWMLELPLFDPIFLQAAHFGFVSEEERLLVETRFPFVRSAGSLLRLAVSAPPSTDAAAFRTAYGVRDPFLLCLGRVEEAKGIPELLSHFAALRASGRSTLRLVLAGPVAMHVTQTDYVRTLGRISETDKWNALAAAQFVAIPSAYESLSIVALEAWASSRALLASGASAVLVGQCRRSNGGLWYANEREFVELAATELFGKAGDLGVQGARYVAAHFTENAARLSLERALSAVTAA